MEIDRVGDLDGDGVHEVAVLGTEPGEDAPQVFVVNADAPQLGDGTLSERMVQRIVFGPGFPRLDATRIAGVGDVNGDSRPDIAVGTFVSEGGSMRARVYVLLGAATPLAVREIRVDGQDGDAWRLEGAPSVFPTDDDFAERALTLGGLDDLNGDGLPEIFVQPADGTQFWVVFGSAAGNEVTQLGDLAATSSGFRVRYSDEVTGFFRSPSVVGDVDGDGTADLAWGDPEFDNNFGRLSLMFPTPPPADLDARPGSSTIREFLGSGAAFRLGWSMLNVGDRNGVPGDELWVGAPGSDGLVAPCEAASNDGNSIFLIYGGGPAAFSSSDLYSGVGGTPVQGACGLGTELSRAGDLDTDGTNDIVAASSEDELIWFDGAYLSSLRPSSPLDVPYRSVSGCRSPSGDKVRFWTDSRRSALLGADVDGDTQDDLVQIVSVDNVGKALVVMPGTPDWRP